MPGQAGVSIRGSPYGAQHLWPGAKLKDQYVGDINDYFKYAYLRRVQRELDTALLVCWMATVDDGGPDGRKRKYLEQPETYRAADPGLFDTLRQLMTSSQRAGLAGVEEVRILPSALFHRDLLEDSKSERTIYFRAAFAKAPATSVVFFDPDNGLEVKSVPKGRKGSSKYLYLDELAAAAENSRSAIVYQHFGRVERRTYLERQFERMRAAVPQHDLFGIAGSHIAFLVAGDPARAAAIRRATEALCARWPSVRAIESAN